MAAKGNAWLAVQVLIGTLTTRSGLPVPGDGGPLRVPLNSAVSIGADGTVSAKGADDDDKARVSDGALEGSNVSPVEIMVAMICAACQFEAQMKMLQTAEENEKAAAQLLAAN